MTVIRLFRLFATLSRIEIGVIKSHEELVKWYKRIGFKESECKKFDHLPFEVLFMYKELKD
jgi:hypothetical protein